MAGEKSKMSMQVMEFFREAHCVDLMWHDKGAYCEFLLAFNMFPFELMLFSIHLIQNQEKQHQEIDDVKEMLNEVLQYSFSGDLLMHWFNSAWQDIRVGQWRRVQIYCKHMWRTENEGNGHETSRER